MMYDFKRGTACKPALISFRYFSYSDDFKDSVPKSTIHWLRSSLLFFCITGKLGE